MVDEGLELGVMSGDQLAAAIVYNHRELLRRECRVLELACAWADWHDQTGLGMEYAPLVERACMVGGPGTPMVSEFCVTELGALQGTGPMAARALVADALDLRYRLLQQAAGTDPHPLSELIGGTDHDWDEHPNE